MMIAGQQFAGLPVCDHRHARAAEGWLELGIAPEAETELARIAPQFHLHPEVLELRWKIAAAGKRWQDCLQLADALTDVFPDHSTGWLYLATTLRQLQRTEEACETLLAVVEEFPDNPSIAYQLSCFLCRLGEMAQAQRWLRHACALGDADAFKRLALEDPDLEPLWDRISQTAA